MVKKIAVVSAALAATLIALSPLAWAAPEPPAGDGPVIGDVEAPGDRDTVGLVNLDDVNVLNGTNVCPDVGVGVAGLLGILGSRDKSDIDCDSLSGN